MAQLREIATRLKRPTATFFLPEPPQTSGRRVDFRSLSAQSAEMQSPELITELRLAHLKRRDALEITEELEEPPPEFTLTLSRSDEPEAAGAALRQALHAPPPGHRLWRDKYSAFSTWRAGIERLGVLVMQASGISTSEMRGCAIAEFPLPVILVNSADAPAGRSFTLLHELTHLALRQDSLCDLSESNQYSSREVHHLEVFCNFVAGAALVPAHPLLSSEIVREHRLTSADGSWSDEQLIALSRTFGTSAEVVLRRLVITGRATEGFYQLWRLRQQRAADSSESSAGFVEYFRRVVNHNGRVFTRLVVDAYNRELITGTELSRKLGMKLSHLPQVEAEINRPGQAA